MIGTHQGETHLPLHSADSETRFCAAWRDGHGVTGLGVRHGVTDETLPRSSGGRPALPPRPGVGEEKPVLPPFGPVSECAAITP